MREYEIKVHLLEDILEDAEEAKEVPTTDSNCNIQHVSNRRELYFAFMKEYNALMGEGEHQILKEEVEVLLAKHSC